MRDLLKKVSQAAGVNVELCVEQSRIRATDIPYLVADTGKARRELGWEAQTPLERTIREMLVADRIAATSSREKKS